MLEAAVAALEPGPIGRPPQPVDPQAAQIAELEARIQQLELELKASRLRAELASALPARADERSPRGKKKRQRDDER
jgi:outer membrane murein-binding lipoprotein Lpp